MSVARCPDCDGIFTHDTIEGHSCVVVLRQRIETLERVVLLTDMEVKIAEPQNWVQAMRDEEDDG